MGYTRHDAVIVTMADYALKPESIGRDDIPAVDLDAFRASLPEDWRRLVVGPVEALINGEAWLTFLPDGSKEGWDLSKEGMEYRIRFQELFGGLIVRWGDEDPTVSREPESAEYGLA